MKLFSLFSSSLLLCASGLAHAQVSISASPIPNGVQITGTCTPGNGKVQVNLIPVTLTPAIQPGKISTKQIMGGPSSTSAGTGCKNGGANGLITMTNSA